LFTFLQRVFFGPLYGIICHQQLHLKTFSPFKLLATSRALWCHWWCPSTAVSCCIALYNTPVSSQDFVEFLGLILNGKSWCLM
jgi:hypothetical protein